ncbi:MAG: glycosyltransferase family 4 protein [Pelagimonas sp.]|jgi:glycosyltransferase involved in cell wall biosynthesis|nr:glycosyltransferase family 4 protein [Pelagimonas sp.]
MKILINAINDNAQPRGPDRYLQELLLVMAAQAPDITFHLCCAPWQTLFQQADYPDNVTVEVLYPARKPLVRAMWQAAVFPRLANARAPDLVFLPNYLWTPGLRAPSVLTAHDLLQFRALDKFGGVKARLLQRLIRWALRRVDHVISVSRFTAGDLDRFTRVPRHKITVIPEGGPDPRRRSAPAEMQFLYVGKIERSKNVDLLIRAFVASQVLAGLNARLVIAGPDGNGSEDIAPLLQHPRVIRPGFVSEDALEHLYLTCRGFVFPSSAEGFGLVLLEAMARGAPVIAADATSLPEVMGDAGLLVPDQDEQALQQALEDLAQSDDLFTRLQAAGYDRLAQFSWDTAAQDTLGVFRKAAKHGGARGR